MLKKPHRVKINTNSDALKALEQVHADKVARIVERNGIDVAVIVSVEEMATRRELIPSPAAKKRALSAAGAWKDIDTDSLVDEIYRWRHESPPSDSHEW